VHGVTRIRRSRWLAPITLFAIALIVRLVAASAITFPATEGSAYYVDVARNLVQGHGMVSDAIWSYATPPLVLPKPAFELWLPMASLASAASMAIFGTSFSAAQVGSVVLGAFIAPLAWAAGREAARVSTISPVRASAVAAGSGLVAAVLGPFVVASAVPDSSTPFLVFGVLAALLMPRALAAASGSAARRTRSRVLPGVALGLVLGLAYLSRQEAVWLGATYLAFALAAVRALPAGRRLAIAVLALLPVMIGGALLVVPWLVRDALLFGTPFPGQSIENAFLLRNEEIFAYVNRPTLAAFLGQGPGTILGHIGGAMGHDLLTVVLVPTFPVGLIGIFALLAMRRSPAFRRATALSALLVSGVLTFLVADVVFPVATVWGTFLHASGPLLVGLSVAAVLGMDACVARVGRARAWSRPNAWLGPAAMLSVAGVLLALEVLLVTAQSRATATRVVAVAEELRALPEVAAGAAAAAAGATPPSRHAVLISDHPIWLADVLGLPVIALPDESPADVATLAADFGSSYLVVFDERGEYPAVLLNGPAATCLTGPAVRLAGAGDPAWLFPVIPGCRP
jgi:hypothetical protein